MPKYDYACKSCLAVEEVTHSIHEDPDIHCSFCGAYMKRRPQRFRAQYNSPGFTKSADPALGDPDKGVPPARPVEFGGTLDTRK